MNDPANNPNKAGKDNGWRLLQILAAIIGLATLGYTILSVAYFIGWGRQVGIRLIIFLSIEDVLINGILPTYFVGAFVFLLAASFWAPIAGLESQQDERVDSMLIKKGAKLLRFVLLCVILVIPFVDLAFKMRGLDVPWWLFSIFLVAFVLLPAAYLIETQPWRRLVPFGLFIVAAIGTFCYGTVDAKDGERWRFRAFLSGDKDIIPDSPDESNVW